MIFVDTSFWVAFRNRRDTRHQQANELIEQSGTRPLVTTNHVRGETWTYLRRRAGHAAAVDFLNVVEKSLRTQLLNVTEEQEAAALRWLRRHDEREFSFVDATSFMLMQSLRLREAFAFNGNFSAAGFTELRA